MLRAVTISLVALISSDFFVLDARYTRATRRLVVEAVRWMIQEADKDDGLGV
jgi:hypothetical protein